jgi:hypothetical protein
MKIFETNVKYEFNQLNPKNKSATKYSKLINLDNNNTKIIKK